MLTTIILDWGLVVGQFAGFIDLSTPSDDYHLYTEGKGTPNINMVCTVEVQRSVKMSSALARTTNYERRILALIYPSSRLLSKLLTSIFESANQTSNLNNRRNTRPLGPLLLVNNQYHVISTAHSPARNSHEQYKNP